MILDAQNLFSDEQAITADAVSTNVVDLGSAGGDNNFSIAITITEAFNTLTSLEIQLQTDSVEAMSSAVVISEMSVLQADLTLGATYEFKVPSLRTEQFLRLNYDVTGTNPTTGTITAAVVKDFQSNG